MKHRQGLRGSDSAHFHPYVANGFFAQEAWPRGVLSPLEIKSRQKVASAQRETAAAANTEATETASAAAAADADATTEPTSPTPSI